MPTRVPALERGIRLLELLEECDADGRTLSELAAAAGMSKSTCHASLATLAAARLVRRGPGKRYRLGLGAVVAGAAAAAGYPAIVPMTAAARRITARTGLPCIVSAVEGGEVVALSVTGEPVVSGGRVRPGVRSPYAAPYGMVFAAWAPPAEQEAWLASVEDRESVRAALASTAARGYAVGLRDAPLDELSALLRESRDATGARRVELALRITELMHAHEYVPAALRPAPASVDFLAAPVLGRGGVVVALTVVVSGAALSDIELRELGGLLVDETRLGRTAT